MATRFLITWQRFGIRSLLVLVLLIGIVVAASMRPFVRARERRAALAELQSTHWASVAFDDRAWHKNERRSLAVIQNGDPNARPGRLRQWLGDRAVNEILLDRDSAFVDADLLAMFPEATVLGRPPAGAPRLVTQATESQP